MKWVMQKESKKIFGTVDQLPKARVKIYLSAFTRPLFGAKLQNTRVLELGSVSDRVPLHPAF